MPDISVTARKGVLIFLKLIVTSITIWWLLSMTDYAALLLAFRQISPVVVVAALGINVLAFLIGSVRWWVLLCHATGRIAYGRVLPSYYLGVFFNNILPSSMGGDVVRTFHLGLRGVNLQALLGSAVADRGIGLFVSLLTGSICIFFSPDIGIGRHDEFLMLGILVVFAVGTWLLFTPFSIAYIERLGTKYQSTRIRRFVLETVRTCHKYRSARVSLIAALVLTAIMQFAVILAYYIIGAGIGITLSVVTYFAVIPIVFLAASIPISIGGIGVREGALVGLLIKAGADTQHAIALSLLYLVVLLLSSLPGGAIALLRADTIAVRKHHEPQN